MYLILIPLLVLNSATLSAEDLRQSVESDECKAIAAKIVQLTGAEFDHISPGGNTIFFRHPLPQQMSLSCTSHRLTGVFLGWDGPFPPNGWFKLTAKTGEAVTGVNSKKLETDIRKCHLQALKDKSELAELDVPPAKIECQAFIRNGGGVSMSIWINDHAARRGIEDPD